MRRLVGFGEGIGLGLRWRLAEQLAGLGEVVGAAAVGKEPVMSDAVEARRQDVEEKAADELVRG